MKTVTLKITRTDTWFPTVDVPDDDLKRYAFMSNDQAADYVLNLIAEQTETGDRVFDEYQNKATLDSVTDVELIKY